MEEKERYEWRYSSKIMKHYMFDNLTKTQLKYEDITNLLNQCDKRIKELEENIKELKEINIVIFEDNKALEKENQELKQQVEAKESVNRAYKATLSLKDSDFSDLVIENANLKQQLAENEVKIANIEVLLLENANDRKAMQEFKIGEDEYDLTDEDARNSLCWEVEELKQQLEEYKTYKNWQDILCCKSAQEVIDFVMSNYLTEDEKCRTIADLKQQLHDLPKEIVEEIRADFLYGIDGETTGIDIILDAILKKYGGENE